MPTTGSSTARHAQDTWGHPDRTLSFLVNLFDAPLPQHGDVHVNIAIAGVDAVSGGTVTPLAVYNTPQIVDLLTLKHAAFQVHGMVPAGAYNAVRLLVDTGASNVVLDGKTYPLVFARHLKGVQPTIIGLDAKINVTGAAGEQVAVAVDFNVLESVKLRGNIAFAKPKLVAAHRAARVEGHVANASGGPVSNATVIAYNGDGSVANTTLTEEDGSFTIHALKPGSYRIAVLNTYVSESGEQVSAEGATATNGPSVNAVVAPGDVLDLGSLSD